MFSIRFRRIFPSPSPDHPAHPARHHGTERHEAEQWSLNSIWLQVVQVMEQKRIVRLAFRRNAITIAGICVFMLRVPTLGVGRIGNSRIQIQGLYSWVTSSYMGQSCSKVSPQRVKMLSGLMPRMTGSFVSGYRCFLSVPAHSVRCEILLWCTSCSYRW